MFIISSEGNYFDDSNLYLGKHYNIYFQIPINDHFSDIYFISENESKQPRYAHALSELEVSDTDYTFIEFYN